MSANYWLGPFGSLPEARSVLGQALMAMLPSLVLRHMILAKSLATILTLFVLRCYTSTLLALFQISNQLRTETH